ncbi:MAG: hypothetical protein IPO08_21520 [Xanthomonadales bacterium]|nr:hypothetical protein [Xanthomonadales bacterium]
MRVVITRPAGTAAVEVFSLPLGRGVSVPAGPCQVEVDEEFVPDIPGAVAVIAPMAPPADPAEE